MRTTGAGWTHVSIAKIGLKRIGASKRRNPPYLVGIIHISALWLIGVFSSVMDTVPTVPGWLVAISNSGIKFAFFRRMLLRLCSPEDLAFGIHDYHLDTVCLRVTVLTAMYTGAASD